MRIAFGLVGLLVTVAIMVWLFSMYVGGTGGVAHQGNLARQQAQQLAGRDDSGMTTAQSITLVAEPANRATGLLVTGLVAGGPMQTHFGLMRNDLIVEIGTQGGLQRVRDFNDPELAKAMALEAFQRGQPLVVLRGEQRLTLPQASALSTPAPAAAPTPAAKPAADPLRRQLDAIPGIR